MPSSPPRVPRKVFARTMVESNTVKYRVYEIKMSDEASCTLEKQLAANEMTLGEYACAALQYAVEHPVEAKHAYEELAAHPEDALDIRLVRYYPVFNGEKEAQARRRKLAEEVADNGKNAGPKP